MPKVKVTAEAESTIRSKAEFEFKGVKPNADGSYTIDLEWDTIQRLRDLQMSGETLSDTIIRVISTAGQKTN